MEYKINAMLPAETHGVGYTENSHFIELTDRNGRKIKVDATGVVRYHCYGCQAIFLLLTNHGPLTCPVCLEKKIEPRWLKPQLAFVPEEESDFRGGFPHEKTEDPEESCGRELCPRGDPKK